MPETEGVTLRQALLNQYQLILAGGAVGLVVLSGALWPALVFLGLECVTLPFVVGNRRLANALAMRRAPALGTAPAEAVLDASALDAGGKKRFDELQGLVGSVERNYRTRLSERSDPLILEQEEKLRRLLETGLSHLRALQVYDDLDRESSHFPDLTREIADLEAKATAPETPERVRSRVLEALEVKKRLAETLSRSKETREALAMEFETLRTALRILAQESAALLAPSEVASRLDDLLRGSDVATRTIEELEDLAREGRRARAAVTTRVS